MENTLPRAATEAERIAKIAAHMKGIMEALGLDLTDEHLRGTPMRVARAYVQELFVGLRAEREPKIYCFPNTRQYQGLLVSSPIQFFSYCAHHFMPFVGQAHIAYIPNKTMIGLSKINRLVHYYARRPQIQEHLTLDLLEAFQRTLGTSDVAVLVNATHFCVISRGVADHGTKTHTAQMGGQFDTNTALRQQLMDHLSQQKAPPSL